MLLISFGAGFIFALLLCIGSYKIAKMFVENKGDLLEDQ